MTPTVPTLDQPLPAELTGLHHGWFTRYRRWPVFSPNWVRQRWLHIGVVLLLSLSPMFIGVFSTDNPANRPWLGLAELVLVMLAAAAAGPLLGLWVRRRGWDERREWWGLVAAIAAVVATLLLFQAYAAEPLKQYVAEHTGDVDEHGKRRRIVMMIGMTIRTPDDPVKEQQAQEEQQDPVRSTLDYVVRGTIIFLLAGGLGLRGWRREREGLAALARERALAEAQAQRREAELRLSVLAAQVEPHFVFNTLAGVRSAIATDPARAAEMIDRLVEYLRASIPRLRSDGSAQATVGGQFEIVRAYLGLMAARMPRLAWSVQADEALLRHRFPPLMLISLAENAVKHGVEPKIGPVRVDLRAERTDDGRLALVVEDDGAGFGASTAGTGLGLANIRERLAQLYGERAALTLKARPGGGVSATITVPLEES
ncbi:MULTISPECIES: sensor histidine kinase [unclassified Rubrivivax]|uniref:sensor histidine kinase n=1 Tax=unclassified Rubrivivax TaxID=2649762 RepID=UPI0013E93DAD|nr:MULTISPECIES: histidine kinase [unclassified Rubrivivax]MCC9597215.1 histidine kinase [Rubrivivax sp. JA1055]MCC9646526.1 histidine kinase [Rubrivivax sp. JA1029]